MLIIVAMSRNVFFCLSSKFEIIASLQAEDDVSLSLHSVVPAQFGAS